MSLGELRGSIVDPEYDFSTKESMMEAQVDVILKVCAYVQFRLQFLQIDIIGFNTWTSIEGCDNSGSPFGTYTHPDTYITLFDTHAHKVDHESTQLSQRDKYVCNQLAIMSGSLNTFWRGFGEDFHNLRQICSPPSSISTQAGAPKNLLQKYFLWYESVHAYISYVSWNITPAPYGEFSEHDELAEFTKLAVMTAFLLSDLLHTGVTPGIKIRDRLRAHERLMVARLTELKDRNSVFAHLWMEARGDFTLKWHTMPTDDVRYARFGTLGSLIKYDGSSASLTR